MMVIAAIWVIIMIIMDMILLFTIIIFSITGITYQKIDSGLYYGHF